MSIPPASAVSTIPAFVMFVSYGRIAGVGTALHTETDAGAAGGGSPLAEAEITRIDAEIEPGAARILACYHAQRLFGHEEQTCQIAPPDRIEQPEPCAREPWLTGTAPRS